MTTQIIAPKIDKPQSKQFHTFRIWVRVSANTSTSICHMRLHMCMRLCASTLAAMCKYVYSFTCTLRLCLIACERCTWAPSRRITYATHKHDDDDDDVCVAAAVVMMMLHLHIRLETKCTHTRTQHITTLLATTTTIRTDDGFWLVDTIQHT